MYASTLGLVQQISMQFELKSFQTKLDNSILEGKHKYNMKNAIISFCILNNYWNLGWNNIFKTLETMIEDWVFIVLGMVVFKDIILGYRVRSPTSWFYRRSHLRELHPTTVQHCYPWRWNNGAHARNIEVSNKEGSMRSSNDWLAENFKGLDRENIKLLLILHVYFDYIKFSTTSKIVSCWKSHISDTGKSRSII